MLILGIHVIGHDLSISLINRKGEIIFIAEEERYSGIKGGNFIFSPILIRQIFSEYNIPFDEVYYIAVVGEPDKWPPKAYSNLSYNPVSRFQHKSIWEDEILAIFPNVDKLYRVNHHLAHAASAYYSTEYEDACILTMDAYGDNETATIYRAKDNQLLKIFSIPFYHSHVYLYEAFAAWLGLFGKEKAGKLMGLSSYGQPIYLELIQSLFDDKSSFFLSDAFSKTKAKAKNWVNVIESSIGIFNNNSNEFTQYYKDLACSMQNQFEKITLNLFEKGQSLVSSKNVCCAGGGFYNSVANGKVLTSNLFSNYFFHPIAGDSGLSLGAAQLLAVELGFKRASLSNVFLGSNIDTSSLYKKKFPDNYTIVEYSHFEELISFIAGKISDGFIIGWCQSNMEVGPRALGNRSILADPRDKNNISRLNKIKNREQWRPFASSVLYEDVNVYFDVNSEYPYMNIVANVTRPDLIPASCHIDGTARIQTVKKEVSNLFYKLLCAFKAKTGISVLLNTSLNIQGRPIARTVDDCLDFFCSGQVDIMVMNNYVILNSSRGKLNKIVSSQYCSSEILSKLDRKFNLVILAPDKKISSKYTILKDLAKGALIIESVLSIGLEKNGESLSNFIQFPIHEQLVVILPWYTEAIEDMMPLLLIELNHLLKRYPKYLLIDIEGKIFLNLPTEYRKDSRKEKKTMTEVEDHYLNLISEKDATI